MPVTVVCKQIGKVFASVQSKAIESSKSSRMSVSSFDRNQQIDFATDKYPFCIVWTPIPLLTWLFPFIGHMGIALSNGVIRDFAGPYFVSEDHMAFGRPTRYLVLDPTRVSGGATAYDEAVTKASAVYGTRMHNLCWDNCHSHVGMALTLMNYSGSQRWNMVRMAGWMFVCGKYVGIKGVLKTWTPFAIIALIVVLLSMYL